MAVRMWFKRTVLAIVFVQVFWCGMAYQRPPARKMYLVHELDGQDSAYPEQVHISVVGQDKMRISWITKDETPAVVEYGTSHGVYSSSVTGTISSYEYTVYKSGIIHDVVIGPLTPNTVYYYRLGSASGRELSFKSPPSQFPVKFAVAGDLGQTEWTKSTLEHIKECKYDVFLLPGDLSYADWYQPLWDTFGRLVEPLASQRPWMVTQGNHEIENIPIIHHQKFTAYNARWRMPFEESGSTSNLYYSFEVAGIHVVALGSYADFNAGSDQYKWLQADLRKVDRKRTPWLMVMVHAPWYNTNTAHQGEEESFDMKASMEDLIYQARVDVVLAGHVHAYERFTRVYHDKPNECGPVYINIGDGGNKEGLASSYIDPQDQTSVFREASFGHGELDVVNATHLLWTWHRNVDDQAMAAESVWLRSLASQPACYL